MSKKKVLKVDKLVIQADEIYVVREGKEIKLEELKKEVTQSGKDPWDIFGPEHDHEEKEEESKEEEHVHDDHDDDKDNHDDDYRGFSWI